MPPYLHVGRFADLLQGFLDLVLAEIALACSPGGSHVIGAERLRDGDEADVRRVPAGAAGGRVDPGPDRLEVGGNGGVHGGRRCYLMYALSISMFGRAFSAFGPFGAIFV